MKNQNQSYPIMDLHCDMLAYLADKEGAHPGNKEDIGCAIPFLREGNVKLQVMAVWTATGDGSTRFANKQITAFQKLCSDHTDTFVPVTNWNDLYKARDSQKSGVVLAIENAAGLCEENEPLQNAFERIEQIQSMTERILYISLTHFGENRFAGGNATETGLKKDGIALLDFINGREIAIDLSHASTRLMIDILNYTEVADYHIPVIASHSNFRSVFEHPRNLPDDVVREIVRRNGLIGINFVRAFVHPSEPEKLLQHILHGFEIGAGTAICFGADFFHWKSIADPERLPYFFEAHMHAGRYPEILRSLSRNLGKHDLNALAYKNVSDFIQREWKA